MMNDELKRLIEPLVLEAAQRLADYEQVEIGRLRLKTWNWHRRDLLDVLELLSEIRGAMVDYDLIGSGHIERKTWRQKMAVVLARAKAAGVNVVPF